MYLPEANKKNKEKFSDCTDPRSILPFPLYKTYNYHLINYQVYIPTLLRISYVRLFP
jgi:hypothetical protein